MAEERHSTGEGLWVSLKARLGHWHGFLKGWQRWHVAVECEGACTEGEGIKQALSAGDHAQFHSTKHALQSLSEAKRGYFTDWVAQVACGVLLSSECSCQIVIWHIAAMPCIS
jgi:hypothetical protein